MSLIEIKVPALGESVVEATIAKWRKNVGDAVVLDEVLVELETDKVTLEITAPSSGVLAEIQAKQGAVVVVGTVLGGVDGQATAAMVAVAPASVEIQAPASVQPTVQPPMQATVQSPVQQPVQAPAQQPVQMQQNTVQNPASNATAVDGVGPLSPAVRKQLADNLLSPNEVIASRFDGRLLKVDVLNHLQNQSPAPSTAATVMPVAEPVTQNAPAYAPSPTVSNSGISTAASGDRLEIRKPMSRLRLRISERLKEAQNTAAILTTFNEIDMIAVKQLRDRYKDVFEKKYGVKLGFMSFFVKACTQALKEIPTVNSRIEGSEIVTNNYYDLGVAVSAPSGLVVPVIRDAELLDLAGIESAIANYGKKAKDGKLTLEEMSGGTFTISNGGVFGSLFSTPIINPPQSAILGMHKIQDRPMAINGRVEIRPMMYVALSYDHRLIDGREAVTFLAIIKDCIENPGRFLLEL